MLNKVLGARSIAGHCSLGLLGLGRPDLFALADRLPCALDADSCTSLADVDVALSECGDAEPLVSTKGLPSTGGRDEGNLEEFIGSLCFEDDGAVIIALDDTLELARRLARSDQRKIQKHLDAELEKASEEHIEEVALGRVGYKRWTWNGSSTRPRIEDSTEAAAIIRGWLGASQVQEWNEIQALRAEVARLSSIISKASRVLQDQGLTRDAASIRRLHGLTRLPGSAAQVLLRDDALDDDSYRAGLMRAS
ncbi:hypothetical protein ABIE18_000147 [Arthrobacter sp. 2762]